MSQSVLANGLGLTFQQVQKYEKGSNRVGGSRMQQLSTLLKVPVGYFFEGLPGHGKEMPGIMQECLATPDGQAMVQAFGNIQSADMRRRLVALAIQIVEDQ